MAHWIAAAVASLTSRDFHITQGLVAIARRKAEAIEASVRRSRRQDWLHALAGPFDHRMCGKSLRKEAFRW
eukprot:6016717-Karenia_brevis.AAC.1